MREEYLDAVNRLKYRLEYLKEMGLESVAGPPGSSPPARLLTAEQAQKALRDIREKMGDCKRCKLHPHRTQIVFGTGNPKADLVFVGEGPGRDEDLQGEPFVGRAGQLLTRMIEAMKLSRQQVYIANIIKCRPPENRNPEADEIAACEPFLAEQLAVIRPVVICALGTFAAQTLLQTRVKITQLRGKFHDYRGIKLMPTFHPAYLLRNPHDKKSAWEDLQKVMAELQRQKKGTS